MLENTVGMNEDKLISYLTEPYQKAYMAMRESSYDTEIVLESPSNNPETQIIKKQAFHSLSEEAKDVILLTLSLPEEFTKFCPYRKEKYTFEMNKSNLVYFLSERGWKKSIIKRVFLEISNYVRTYI